MSKNNLVSIIDTNDTTTSIDISSNLVSSKSCKIKNFDFILIFIVQVSNNISNNLKEIDFNISLNKNNSQGEKIKNSTNNTNNIINIESTNKSFKLKNTTMNETKTNIKEEYTDFKVNLENIISGKDKRTTIMLRNIPNKYTLQNLVDEINSLFLGRYDYINLPIDYEVKKIYFNFKIITSEKIKSWLWIY